MVHIVVVIALASGGSWTATFNEKAFATVEECQEYVRATDFDEDFQKLLARIPMQSRDTFHAAVECSEGDPV